MEQKKHHNSAIALVSCLSDNLVSKPKPKPSVPLGIEIMVDPKEDAFASYRSETPTL